MSPFVLALRKCYLKRRSKIYEKEIWISRCVCLYTYKQIIYHALWWIWGQLLSAIGHGQITACQSLEGCVVSREDKLCPQERNTLACLICLLKSAWGSGLVRRLMLIVNQPLLPVMLSDKAKQTGHPERFWSLHLWKYSKPSWREP